MSNHMNGYAGYVLRINLSDFSVYKEEIEKYIPAFIGGRGVNQIILLRETLPSIDAFSPVNKICIGAGALAGTLAPSAGRLNIDSKNVLTGGIGSGNAGGWFASELKFAGYDNIIIEGKAKTPVYIEINDDNVSFHSAVPIWGERTGETVRLIKEETGEQDAEVLCIGPAGENMVSTSGIIVSESRVVGRCGLGGVMGSKNLKAISVKGTKTITVYNASGFIELTEKITKRLRASDWNRAHLEFGTLASSAAYNSLSALSYKNYHDDYIPDQLMEKISHQEIMRNCVSSYACTACPLPCGHTYQIERGNSEGSTCYKVEANAVWNFGGRLAIDDPLSILEAQEKCCQLGLDIDNAASAIAWAVDCFEAGLITKDQTDGLELGWGDAKVVMELLRKTAYREGFGNLLAEGSFRASKIIGPESERFSYHVKGQDLVEGIRSMKGWALGIVVSPRGATHTRGALATERNRWSKDDSLKTFGISNAGDARDYEGKALALAYMERANALWDALGVCFFAVNRSNPEGMTPSELTDLFRFATGFELTENDLMISGERLHTIEKMFNIHHAGFARSDDYPPLRLMEEPISSGPLRGELLKREDWDRMLNEYYDIHGWSRETGWPPKERLYKLGLGEFEGFLTSDSEVKRREN